MTVPLFSLQSFLFGLPQWLTGKESTCNSGDLRDMGLIPGLGRSPGGGHGNPLQCSCLENPTNRGAWRATVHRVTDNWIWLKWLNKPTRFVCPPLKVQMHPRYRWSGTEPPLYLAVEPKERTHKTGWKAKASEPFSHSCQEARTSVLLRRCGRRIKTRNCWLY